MFYFIKYFDIETFFSIKLGFQLLYYAYNDHMRKSRTIKNLLMMQVFTFPYFLQTPHAEVYNVTKLLLC